VVIRQVRFLLFPIDRRSEKDSPRQDGKKLKENYMNDWKEYRKKGTQTMRPYKSGEDLTEVSVSPEDTPEEGGMIAINKENPKDQWYVAKDFFEKNYEIA
jgi:hypothetical protein